MIVHVASGYAYCQSIVSKQEESKKQKFESLDFETAIQLVTSNSKTSELDQQQQIYSWYTIWKCSSTSFLLHV